MQRLCADCGEAIDEKRLFAMPHAQLCVACANDASGVASVISPPKPMASKPSVTTAHHLKRYLTNVGQKTEEKALFRTLVRVNYLFPHITAKEMVPIFIQWAKTTSSPFDHEQIRDLVNDARQWVENHPDKRV